jgi:hypothetical protein
VYDADISVKGGAVCTLFKVARNLSVEERKLRIVKIFYDLLVSPNEEMIKRMSGLSGPTFEIVARFFDLLAPPLHQQEPTTTPAVSGHIPRVRTQQEPRHSVELRLQFPGSALARRTQTLRFLPG